MECELSIIIPVYGVEKYLSRCLEILIEQEKSLKNLHGGYIEIILVDDGSIDKSPQICDEYAKRNKYLKVIHKGNAGLASARNKGLEIAKGKWIAFYRKIIRDKQIKQWIVIDSSKERVIEIFKLLYKTKSPVICDMTYSFLFEIRNLINQLRSK